MVRLDLPVKQPGNSQDNDYDNDNGNSQDDDDNARVEDRDLYLDKFFPGIFVLQLPPSRGTMEFEPN